MENKLTVGQTVWVSGAISPHKVEIVAFGVKDGSGDWSRWATVKDYRGHHVELIHKLFATWGEAHADMWRNDPDTRTP